MSGNGPEVKDKIRQAVQPLLDSIAPDCIVNQLELYENARTRVHNPDIPNVPEIRWQDDFFEKKIRQPMCLDVLDYNAWEDETDLEKAKDIFSYLFDKAQSSQGLKVWIQGVTQEAPNYIHELKGEVQYRLGSEVDLDLSEMKALSAFSRMIDVQMSFNLSVLLKKLEVEDQRAFLLSAGTHLSRPFENVEAFAQFLQDHTKKQASFSVKERILFRCQKAVQLSLPKSAFSLENTNTYFMGDSFNQGRSRALDILESFEHYPVGEMHAARGLVHGTTSLVGSAIKYPLIFAQQVHNVISSATSLPFRLFRSTVRDVPLVGRGLDKGAYIGASIKNVGLATAEVTALVWLSLLEITRLTGESPEQHIQNSPLGELMTQVSPWLSTLVKGYAVLAGTGLLGYVGSLIYKSKSGFGAELKRIVIEENVNYYKQEIMTPEYLQERPQDVLACPIMIPREIQALMSQKELNNIALEIARQRQTAFAEAMQGYEMQDTAIGFQNGLWYPIYTPMHEDRRVFERDVTGRLIQEMTEPPNEMEPETEDELDAVQSLIRDMKIR